MTAGQSGSQPRVETGGGAADVAWDDFLLRNPRGQFQQTSGWAQVKVLDGWNTERILFRPDHLESGGAQLLWKRTRFGRIGYVSKGPVLPNEDPVSVRGALTQITATASALGLRAIILQPPDDSSMTKADLSCHGFDPRPLGSVVRSTAIIEVGAGREKILSQMGRQARREARVALERGVRVRKGGRGDLKLFFDLMVETCRRQHAHPNPSRLELFEALWDGMQPRVSLAFAEAAGETVAGLLMISHGGRLMFWKKGWNSRGTHLHANTLLMIEALGWAADDGFSIVDFGAVELTIAETMLAGRALDAEQQRSRDKFNLRLGARPKLIPPAQLLILNPVARRIYEIASRSRTLEAWMMRRFGPG